jgi:hypothetical protein
MSFANMENEFVRKRLQPPWASGPGEILKHGLGLLKEDSDTNRRLAMISIDNAIELMMKTYLGLPQRITGLTIARNEYREFSESFPKLLDALEKYASDKLDGINLGEIEWYHRLRNELYHQGNGLTVERDKVEVYAELANILFVNLFGFRLVEPENESSKLLGDFMEAWITYEKLLTENHRKGLQYKDSFLSAEELSELKQIRKIRTEVIHGVVNYKTVLNSSMVRRLKELNTKIESSMQS